MESEAKFCFSKSRMLVLTAVFISLSVCTSATESRQCYWCGPLAEQVHRSRRAPQCEASGDHVIACDPGLNHCAIIASSPPYTESRLCVKYYQDECYSQYCNTTKTWRMTCPCRGDLCNGPNTERENEAFAILVKLVAKTQNTRIKRTLISSPNFVSGKKYKIDINATQSNTTQDNEDKNSLDANKLSDQANVEIESENIKIDVTSSTEVSEKGETTHLIEDDAEISDNHFQKTDQEIKHPTPIPTKGNEVIQFDETISMVVHEVKSSEFPTAEALQQNASPADISIEPRFIITTAIDSTVTVPINHDTKVDHNMMMSIEPTPGKNNTATKMHKHILTPIIAMILHHLI